MLDDRSRGLVDDFLHTLPCTNFVLAYGSAVFSQKSDIISVTKQADEPPMLDLIVFVRDAREWHGEVGHHHSLSMPVYYRRRAGFPNAVQQSCRI